MYKTLDKGRRAWNFGWHTHTIWFCKMLMAPTVLFKYFKSGTDGFYSILSVISCFTSFGGAILCYIAFRHPSCNTRRSRRVRLHKRGGPEVYLSSTNLSFFAEGLNEKRIRLGELYSYCAVQRIYMWIVHTETELLKLLRSPWIESMGTRNQIGIGLSYRARQAT